MKRKYSNVEFEIMAINCDIVTSSGEPSDDPNQDDAYDLSAFAGLFSA
ncbi:MAG: hypothetical protein IJA89_08995 [Clostridia bacterium]|nr:hypothetical protein [Clostridia bacterium]